MKLSELKGVNAIDAIADIIDPMSAICSDKEVVKAANSNKSELEIAQVILKRQARNILDVLAILSGENPKEYNPTLPQILTSLVGLISDIKENEELVSLFRSQPQMTSSASFGAVMPTSEGTETI